MALKETAKNGYFPTKKKNGYLAPEEFYIPTSKIRGCAKGSRYKESLPKWQAFWWRMRRDSNSRRGSPSHAFEACSLDRSDTHPVLLSNLFIMPQVTNKSNLRNVALHELIVRTARNRHWGSPNRTPSSHAWRSAARIEEARRRNPSVLSRCRMSVVCRALAVPHEHS